jgi:hypothetical protein
MAYYFNVFYIFLFIGSSILFASESERKYEVPSAMIIYSIEGGGILTDESNITITGKGKLRFKEWGEVELFEEAVEETVSGALHNIETTQVCQKLNHKQALDVDFKNKKILERQIPQGKRSIQTDGLIQKSTERIAGYMCDMWEAEGVRKCIYKGMPLLIEYNALGLSYKKQAVYITFDINSSLSRCTIPSYPVQKFSLFKTNIKTKSKRLPKVFSKRLMEVLKEITKELKENNISADTLSPKKKRVWLEKMGANIFEKQKVLLPQFLMSMKKARVCLQQARNWIEANSCLDTVASVKEQFSNDRKNSIESWRGKERERVLDLFDSNISLLESKMKCIRSSKNITDLSSCMQ